METLQRATQIITLLMVASCCVACTPNHTEPSQAVVPSKHSRTPELVSLLGKPLYAQPVGGDQNQRAANLKAAKAALALDPHNPEKMVWVGRRLGYLWKINDAVEIYTLGLALHAGDATFLRHRGHRYISLRRFDEAVTDLEKAAQIIEGLPDIIEADGLPNSRGIPLTTLGFNVWYHLGLAHYLQGDFSAALIALDEAMNYAGPYDDNLVAVTDWKYMALRRLRRHQEAERLLERIQPSMEMIENHAYHRRLLMYKGLISPSQLLDTKGARELDIATQGYGLGNWFLCNGDQKQAIRIFKRVVSGPHWPAFGYIAAEVDLALLTAR